MHLAITQIYIHTFCGFILALLCSPTRWWGKGKVYNRQRKHSRGSQAGLAKQYRTDGNRTEDSQHKTDGKMGEEQYNILLLEY
ncbi:hypothetical protein Pint_31021 [Pistacia integerrima]|uniref:Uncharacterized protein n=1 Tax=Pistacia integerrima TaxID=434235 RepID=A0ACC0XPU4_9ROSI|nr:hypothetical protein Pint_31021 [Pistacia integerrima]